MLRRLHISVRIALLVTLFSLGAFAEDRYLVKVTGDVNGIAKRYGLTVVKSLTGSASGHHILSSKGAIPQTVLRNLSMEFAVRSAEAEKAVHLPGIKPASPLHPAGAPAAATRLSSTLIRYHNSYAASAYVNQPATDVINMDRAHTLATGKGIVATIDTGADFTHSVLRESLIGGWDFVHNWPLGQEQADLNQETTPILDQETTPILDQETTPILDQETTPILDGGTAVILQQETTPILDQETTPILDGKEYPAYGHGTMVAGLIHLVAPDARIMPLRAFGADGSATISQIVQAIYFAVDREVDVINMSFSVKQDSPTLKAALDYAVSKGVICVASAGNDGTATQVWPAAYSTVIGVAATDNSMIRASFSNYGSPLVTLAAPGAGVITTYPKEHYAQVWGTSFSAPLVSAAASLLLDMNSKTNPTMAVKDLSHATAIGQELGAGELDLYQACLAAKQKGN
jgi:subtilisin family serine protease